MPTALYVHPSGLDRLPGILRVYEGCARVLSGQVEGTTIVKLRRQEPKISYLSYPRFDEDGHPSLAMSVRVDLRSFDLKYRNFAESSDPPILHRKEEFVPKDYPSREVFTELTHEEEAAGMFENPNEIGSRQRWDVRLKSRNLRILGHQLNRSA
jgi:DNA phosphorothioation-associated putative methyltransferase